MIIYISLSDRDYLKYGERIIIYIIGSREDGVLLS